MIDHSPEANFFPADKLVKSAVKPDQNYQRPQDRLYLKRSKGSPVSLENNYLGFSVFLVLSGPSLNNLDLSLLDKTKAFSFGVNNSWSIYKPTFWTCMDGPEKFISSGWKDPRIMKLVPDKKQGDNLRTKVEGRFKELKTKTSDCPNTFYYKRNLEFDPTTFLTEGSVNWGQTGNSQDLLGIAGCRSVMLAAIRLCYYLGFRTINLLGCDFKMEEGKQNYAFPQERVKSSVLGNNNTYQGLVKRFHGLLPHFNNHGLKIYNCNKESQLGVFPYRSYEESIKEFELSIPDIEDTSSWYDKENKIRTVRRNGKRNRK